MAANLTQMAFPWSLGGNCSLRYDNGNWEISICTQRETMDAFNFIIRYKVVSMSEPVTIQMKASELCTVF